jgi:hypothetical protein
MGSNETTTMKGSTMKPNPRIEDFGHGYIIIWLI